MTKLDPEGMSSENILFNLNQNIKYMMSISLYIEVTKMFITSPIRLSRRIPG